MKMLKQCLKTWIQLNLVKSLKQSVTLRLMILKLKKMTTLELLMEPLRRSEERRVGKECRHRWRAEQKQKKHKGNRRTTGRERAAHPGPRHERTACEH